MVKSYFANNADVLDWRKQDNNPKVKAWKPEALPHEQWPPNYRAVYAWRLKQLALLRGDPRLLASAKAYYRTRPAEFIMHWMDTYDPRREGEKWIPFVFFKRQEEFITFLVGCSRDGENGLTEKCRDAGATWLACGYTIHSWLFLRNDAIGWGSRKQELVDKIGDASSIFEKLRLIVRRLPDIWRPKGLKERDHMTFMKLINPENGSVVTGETGDNIGRGGRTRMYFKDESAHYERPEKIEAALGDNTNVQIDISSVNGLGNVFHRRREAGVLWSPNATNLRPGFTRVFIIDWRDHPAKTQAWYDQRKAKYDREGMLHVFAQEVDRNYSAAIANTIIPYEWIEAAVDAHKKIRWRDAFGNVKIGFDEATIANNWIAGLDVADGGIDRNGLVLRQWIILREAQEWGERDPGMTTRRAVDIVRPFKRIAVQYDCIGVGSSVKSEYNRLVDEKLIEPQELRFVPWNAGAAVTNPFDRIIPDDDESPMNKDFFYNMKAQAWWSLRARFYKVFKNITEGIFYPADEMISLDSRITLLHQLKKELAQPTRITSTNLRTLVDKTPDGMKSPNLGDATVQAYFPIDESKGTAMVGGYSL
jgi:hypothetical protein